mgnify:CR=1 FL=1
MRKTDLFPENDSPGCELREPERPIDAPYAVDIPAVPTALGALDAASRAEFWAALALSHTDGLGARSRKRLLDAFGSAFEAVRRANDWRETGLREDLIREFPLGKMARARPEEWTQHGKLAGTGSCLMDRQPLPSAAQGLAGCADTPLLPRGHEPARQSLREHRRNRTCSREASARRKP